MGTLTVKLGRETALRIAEERSEMGKKIVEVLEDPRQAEATAMREIIRIAKEEGIKVEWAPDEDYGGRYEMSISGGGIREYFSACNDVISATGSSVSLLVRRPRFLPHAEQLARRLSSEGYTVRVKKDF